MSMEVGDKLSELNMTREEMEKLTKALKDDKFKEMLREYAQEISDPENRKKYEEEIKLLERERGNSLEFIHPTPFRALKTSVDGKHKCFINICGNDQVGKPECKCGFSEDGRRGQSWSLPHSLHPGRQDTDAKGSKIMIYDVVFHPDTLHIARTSEKFMDVVVQTAVQGIQNSFHVRLDENNVREIKTRYKGSPQPCVVRRPIPGHEAQQPGPLSFPYPEEPRPAPSSQAKPVTSDIAQSKPKTFQVQCQKTSEPTKPGYSVKYRSVVDLQDYRCSRDSTRSPRPNALVVTVDLPLVKSVTDARLEVKERSLLLETETPAYRLELPLAYAVDEDKGEAKFNKHTGQLTVTLPVLPRDVASSAPVSVTGSGESEEEKRKRTPGSEEENEEEGGRAEESRQREEGGDEENRGRGQTMSSQETVDVKGDAVGENKGSIEPSKEGQDGEEERGDTCLVPAPRVRSPDVQRQTETVHLALKVRRQSNPPYVLLHPLALSFQKVSCSRLRKEPHSRITQLARNPRRAAFPTDPRSSTACRQEMSATHRVSSPRRPPWAPESKRRDGTWTRSNGTRPQLLHREKPMNTAMTRSAVIIARLLEFTFRTP